MQGASCQAYRMPIALLRVNLHGKSQNSLCPRQIRDSLAMRQAPIKVPLPTSRGRMDPVRAQHTKKLLAHHGSLFQ
jgi:hypothetical protein